MLPFIERYLDDRRRHLQKASIGVAMALFPNLARGADGFYSPCRFREIKHEVEKLSGVEFKLKDFRPTLTTMNVNGDLPRLPAMSAQLRHNTIATTQRSYFRMEQGVVGRQLKNCWEETPVRTPKNPVIENKRDYTGYA